MVIDKFKNMTKEQWKQFYIKKSKEVHNNKYDYSRVTYRNAVTKVEIICPIHGSFWQPLLSHSEGRGCQICSRVRTNKIPIFNLDTFVNVSNIVHNNKYDYSKVKYTNNKEKVEIICPIHGSFWQSPTRHTYKKHGCRRCASEINARKTTITGLKFKEDAKKVHGDKYDYCLIKDDDNQAELRKFPILCKKCNNVFKQKYVYHVKLRYNCPYCAKDVRKKWIKENKRITKIDFIRKAKDIHGNKYNYSNINYINLETKIKIKCHKHGYFLQSPSKHIYTKSGCPLCKYSQGEAKIERLLKKIGIKYIREYKVDRFSYDFYIRNLKLLIEYDGKQHFTPSKYYGGISSFEKTKLRDKIKNKLARLLGYRLIRLNYRQFNKLEKYLILSIYNYYKFYYNGKFYINFLDLVKKLNLNENTNSRDYNKYRLKEYFKEYLK